MGFSSYTGFGYPQYGDLGPPESWQSRAIREQGELIGRLQSKTDELERNLSDALKQLNKLEEALKAYKDAFRERGIRL